MGLYTHGLNILQQIHLFCKPILISKTSTELWCSLHIHNLLKLKKWKKAMSSNISQFSILTKLFFYHSPPYVSGFCKHSELLIPSFFLLCNDISYWSCVSPSPWHSCISCIQMRHSGVWTGQTGRQRLVGRVEARQEEAIFTSTPSTATCGRTKRLHSPVTSCILDLQ